MDEMFYAAPVFHRDTHSKNPAMEEGNYYTCSACGHPLVAYYSITCPGCNSTILWKASTYYPYYMVENMCCYPLSMT